MPTPAPDVAEAVANAVRLAKPSGVIFVAFISVAAHLRDIAMRDPAKLVNDEAFCAKYLQDGRYEKSKAGIGNVHSFHAKVGDIKSFFAHNFAETLELLELRSQEGILGGSLDATLSKSEPDILQAWADLMYENYSTGEEHLGCADYLVAILRKKQETCCCAISRSSAVCVQFKRCRHGKQIEHLIE